MKKNITIAGMSFNNHPKDKILVAIFDSFVRLFELKTQHSDVLDKISEEKRLKAN
jgi:hypothetical protein